MEIVTEDMRHKTESNQAKNTCFINFREIVEYTKGKNIYYI